MKRFLGITLALLFVLTLLPAGAFAKVESSEQKTDTKQIYPGQVVLDEDSSGGYEGDYVVIYNPATSSSTSYSTGTMTGRIETSVGGRGVDDTIASDTPESLHKIDIDSRLAEMAANYEREDEKPEEDTRASYNVGDTKSFKVLANGSTTSNITFKCLAKGEHCYIWTPTSSSGNLYPLDTINSEFADIAKNEFDSKFDLMQSSFGDHSNGTNGDGRLHIMYYNITGDNWAPGGGGYIAGFFWQTDFTNNGLPMLNIDTYPGVRYETTTGNYVDRMDGTYSTMVHEYQHLIHYSQLNGNTSTWLNECMSAAAEEICYPGSSTASRVQSWMNYYYGSSDASWANPPKEVAYQSGWTLHNGFSLYNWDNDLEMDDTLALYAQVSFFAQFIYSRFGNTAFKSLITQMKNGKTFVNAFSTVTGVSIADFAKQFRVAVTANMNENVLNGLYSFKMQPGYDPTAYHNVENLFNCLAPVVFTGSSCSIKGGGSITVKPVNGVYNPPSGASSSLKYIGIRFVHEAIDSVSLDDITVKVGGIGEAKLNVLPAATADYTVTYTSAAPGIFTVDGNGVISGVSVGSGTLNAVVHDNVANTDFQASCTVTVENFLGYVRADSVEVGEKYIIVSSSAISGNTGYAVGNQAPANNHYMSGEAVTILDEDAIAYDDSIDFDAITWIPAGSASTGYTWQNVGNNKYMGLDSGGYVCPSTTSVAWLYEEGTKGFNNQVESSGYYYLVFDDTNLRYTNSMSAEAIRLYKYVEPVINYNITAVSNNVNYGTVEVSGSQIICTPAAGYYVENAEVISGTASVAVNGNTVIVTAQSDCTIRVNFAPKPVYTVNFVASGSAEGSVSAYVNDEITLPASVSVAAEGWTFVGWMTAQLEETSTAPEYFAPGASYTVTGNATLYALFTRVEGSGETVYELVTEAPADWTGNYVITCGTTTSMLVLKGISGNTSYESTSAGGSVSFSNTGMTLNGTYLANVSNDYIFAAEQQGSSFSLKNASKSTYLGSYNSYLYSRSSYQSNYCNWSLEYDASNACMKVSNSASSSYPYLVKGSNSYFVINSTYTTNKTQLWKETTLSTTYYNTDPVEPSTNTHTVTFLDWNGTQLAQVTVNDGEAATAPADPTREGYVFTGWDTDFSEVHEDLTVTATYGILGDLDFDGSVTAVDALMALRIALESVTATDAELAVGDMDGDGEISAIDALTILRISMSN